MPDKILICQNCKKTFVYSEYEQTYDAKLGKQQPVFDPICASIKAQEKKTPPKPTPPLGS